MTCLGVPVPKRLEDLVKEPAVRTVEDRDRKAVSPIRTYGKGLNVPHACVEFVCNLANGPSDLAVIVNAGDITNLMDNFATNVSQSITLRSVDELIKVSTKAAQRIANTSVFDLRGFKNYDEPNDDLNFAYHALLRGILVLKRPKVILSCWDHEWRYKDPMNPFSKRTSLFAAILS